MDFFSLGEHINVKDYNNLVYLLRKFKRLNQGLRLGSLTLESDYGSFVFDKALTSVGGNFIIEEEVNISSSDCLRNCFYSFVFSVIDVNTSGTVNKRTVKVTGGTGDDGSLFVTLPVDLIESDEVILPDFEVDIVFDEHEYYTPIVDVVNVDLVSDKRFVGSGEVATVTATLSDRDGELLVGVPCNFNVNGTVYSEVTDSNGQAEWSYTGTGVSTKIDIRVITTRLTIYDSVMTATVTGGSVRLGANMVATGDILIDWGDGTTTTRKIGGYYYSSHTYTDGLNEHTICFVGEITSLGESCFINCTGLTSITIPNTVTSLGRQCFMACKGLTSIVLPNSVESLGYGCFQLCTGLTSVIIPNSVTSIGNYCFNSCGSLVDYQLYWKDSAIIEYKSTIMPVKANTYFTIPQGQRTQYLNKHYPNKIKIRGYDLSVTTDKQVIKEDETATVTATLTYNMEPISDETVSYTIRQGSTIIDTGTDTTDNNGQIEVEYTGTSIGKLTITTTYDTLTETTTIYDTIKYDNGTTTDHNDIWTLSKGTLIRTQEYSILTETSISLDAFTSIPNPCIIEFEINQRNGGTTGFYLNFYHTSKSNYRGGTSLSHLNRRVGEWVPVRVELDGATALVTDLSTGRSNTRNLNDSDTDLLSLFGGGDITELWFRNFRVYNSSGTGKVDTSISISSDKASYYTDESIILSGSLVDDDSQPLVNASVKLYRGASLVDTVSTDSSGAFDKTVTGLSAGSYSFKAVYDGDDIYESSTSSSVSVIVQNHTYSLSISSDKQIILTTESVTISGTLLKDSNPYTSQSVDLYDGATKIATLTTDSDGEYEETVSGLSVGVHTFKAVNANAESSTISVTVSEPTHTYSLSIASDKQSILTTESVTLSGQLLMDSSPYASQSVALYDGSTLVATLTTDSDGEYEETVSGLSVGTHTFKAVHTNAESSTVTVTVNKITTTTSISASSSSILTTDTLVLTGSVSNASTGSVKIYDGATLVDTVSLSSGAYSKSLTGLSVGTHTYKAVYDGDTDHTGSESSTVTVSVNDYSILLSASNKMPDTGEVVTLTALLENDGVAVSGATVSFNIGGSTSTATTNNSGVATVSYTATGSAGNVQVTASYSGVSDSLVIHDGFLPTDILVASDLTKYEDSSHNFEVEVYDFDGQHVGAGHDVVFNINGVDHTRSTNSSGVAVLTIGVYPGVYPTTSTTVIDGVTVTVENTVTVLPRIIPEKLQYVKVYGESLTIPVTILDGEGDPDPDETVTFNVNGVSYDRTTDSNGVARLNFPNLMPGTVTMSVECGFLTAINMSIKVVENHIYNLTLASDKQTIDIGEAVTFSGVLTDNNVILTGESVQLYDGDTLLDTVTTDDTGTYTKTISTLTQGNHSLKAKYGSKESSVVTVRVGTPDYSLSVTGTKSILSYADSESCTVTATLTDNGVAVSGETLSYTIKHGATTIDSGSDTTDSSGQISFSYASAGVGDVTVEVSYDMSLQEIFVVEDYVKIYPNTYTSQTNLNYAMPSTPFEVAFTLTKQTGVGYIRIGTNTNNCIIIGQVGNDGSNGIARMNNGSYSNLKLATTTPTINVPTDIKCRFDGNTYEYTIDDETITNADVGQALTTLILVYCTNGNSINNLRIKAL